MLTVKFMKNDPRIAARIVEGVEVSYVVIRPGELVKVRVKTAGDRPDVELFLAPRGAPTPPGIQEGGEFYSTAYVENSRGATTQVIKA